VRALGKGLATPRAAGMTKVAAGSDSRRVLLWRA
jgi:hypothetical protein